MAKFSSALLLAVIGSLGLLFVALGLWLAPVAGKIDPILVPGLDGAGVFVLVGAAVSFSVARRTCEHRRRKRGLSLPKANAIDLVGIVFRLAALIAIGVLGLVALLSLLLSGGWSGFFLRALVVVAVNYVLILMALSLCRELFWFGSLYRR